MDPGLDPRIELGHRRVDVGETAGNLYLELGIGQMPQRCDPGQDIARDQAQRDAVRVVDDDRVVDLKAQLEAVARPASTARWSSAGSIPFSLIDVFVNIIRRPTPDRRQASQSGTCTGLGIYSADGGIIGR